MDDEEKQQSAGPTEEELRKAITAFEELISELRQHSPFFILSEANAAFFHDAAQTVADITIVLINDVKTRTVSDPVSVAEKMAIIDLIRAGNTLHAVEGYLNVTAEPWFGNVMDYLNVNSAGSNASANETVLPPSTKKERGRPRKKPKTDK